LKQYSQTKDSTVSIIGRIPKSWSILKGKYFLKIHGAGKFILPIDKNDYENFFKVEDLNNSNNEMILDDSESYISKSGKIIQGPLILIPKRGEAIHTNKVVITPHNCSFDSNIMGITTKKFNLRYVAYYLLSRKLSDIADTSTIPQINNKHIYPLKFPKPSISEQNEIVYYLDKKTKTIDNEIIKNQNLIKLLLEKKQSEINRAVTKGLDDTVPMKNLEVQWFGKIPKGWSIQKIKFHYEITTGKVLQSNKNNDNEILINFITAGNVFWNTLDLNDLTKMWATPEQINKLRLKENDLLICEGGEAGRSAILTGLKTDCILQNHVHRLRGKNYFSNKFLMYVMKYYDDISLLQTIVEKVTLTSLSTSDLGNIQMPLPPTDDEIEQITSYLDKKTKKIDSLISKVELQISKLQEFRESLISSAITGKIKVTQA
jgi:type I restriction enzyme, S subunit